MPPSFPFGGMENPRLTFATPTVLAGDRSLDVARRARARALVVRQPRDQRHVERLLAERRRSRPTSRIGSWRRSTAPTARTMLQVLGRRDLVDDTRPSSKDKPGDQVLHIDLTGRDPDDGATMVPYKKGAAFLRTVEQQVGRDAVRHLAPRLLRAPRVHLAHHDRVPGRLPRIPPAGRCGTRDADAGG